MATLSQIKVGNVTYDICDASTRSSVSSLQEEVSSLNNSVSSLNNSVSSLNNSVSSLNSNLETVVSENHSTVSVGSESYSRIQTINLTPGTYLILAACYFSSNSSGYRKLYFTNSSNTGNNAPTGGRFVENAVSSVNGTNTWLYLPNLLTVTSTTTYYLTVFQNSGSILSCTAGYKYIKLA